MTPDPKPKPIKGVCHYCRTVKRVVRTRTGRLVCAKCFVQGKR